MEKGKEKRKTEGKTKNKTECKGMDTGQVEIKRNFFRRLLRSNLAWEGCQFILILHYTLYTMHIP